MYGSAHIVLQFSRYPYPNTDVFVFPRDPEARAFALELGAVWKGDTADRSPEPLHAIVDTTPAWKPVVEALANLRPGGALVINAIRKEDGDKSYLLRPSYQDHLWLEKEIKSVANVTHRNIAQFLPIAAQIPLRPEVQAYRLEVKRSPVCGAKVLLIDSSHSSPGYGELGTWKPPR